MAMRLHLFEEAAGLHHLDDQLARREAVLAVHGRNRRRQLGRRLEAVEEVLIVPEAYGGLDGHDVDGAQTVALADLEIVEIVRRRDLDRAGALFRIGVFVGDDGNAAADQRQDDVLADQAGEALVIRDGRQRRYRRAWFPAGSWRPR